MSFSFVVVDKQNQIDLAFLLAFLNKNYADYEVLYCSSQKMQQTDEVKSARFGKGFLCAMERILNGNGCFFRHFKSSSWRWGNYAQKF